ncbi:endolytic transglycosylase MltG [Ileibacterium valens]|uniref:endolytic transglycosylase MltG n=1 Tax=Ileibacterium valens TaxID=1862668 RepID=UPI0023524F41|nr:endolytic transglycosylase MltG [Ileibacterium valens]
MSNSSRRSKPKKKRRVKVWLVIVLVLLLIVLAAVGGFYFWYSGSLKPAGNAEDKQTIVIEDGESYDQMLDELEQEGFIKSANAAKIYAKLSGSHTHFAGNFTLNKGMSTPEVLQFLADQNNIDKTYAVVTIPEGYWAKQIAKTLCESFPEYKPEDFMNLWNDPAYIDTLAVDYPFLNTEILNNSDLFVKLEGYLFPETYYIDFGSTPDQITRIFLNQFATVYDKYKAQIEASPYTLEEILTLASIVQFESGKADEMPMIAGIFYNRLNQGMPLQSSVTVCYALQDQFDSAQACETNTDIDSPYNTYIYAGIPIGPILNPGEEAIKAVLEPVSSDYLFFVSDIHGDGSIHYAKTYEEHLANVEKFNLNIE